MATRSLTSHGPGLPRPPHPIPPHMGQAFPAPPTPPTLTWDRPPPPPTPPTLKATRSLLSHGTGLPRPTPLTLMATRSNSPHTGQASPAPPPLTLMATRSNSPSTGSPPSVCSRTNVTREPASLHVLLHVQTAEVPST